jgi:hypothetical protein
MFLYEIEWEGIGGIHLAHDREKRAAVLNTAMKLMVSQNAEN